MAEGKVNAGRGRRNEKQLLPLKPLYLLVDGRENYNTPHTESTEAVSSPSLAELKIPRPCCCVRLFLGPVSAGGAGSLGRVAEHPRAAIPGRGAKS